MNLILLALLAVYVVVGVEIEQECQGLRGPKGEKGDIGTDPGLQGFEVLLVKKVLLVLMVKWELLDQMERKV